jgi:hypothetical protein
MKNAMKTPKDVKEMTRIVNVPVQPLRPSPSLPPSPLPSLPQEEEEEEEEQEYENEDYENDEEEQEEQEEYENNLNNMNQAPVINLSNMNRKTVNNRLTQPPINKNISPNNNINTLLAKVNANNKAKAPFANARNSLNLAEGPLTNEDIIPTREVVTSTGKIYVPTHAVAPQLGGSLLKAMSTYVRSQRKTRKVRKRKIDGKRRTRK